MSDRVHIAVTAPEAAWWRGELVRFSARARHWLSKNFPTLRRLHEDLVSETLLQLTTHLGARPEGLPLTWFQPLEPPEDDIRRFHALAMTVLNRRVTDHFRADYRQWVRELPLDDAGSSEQAAEQAATGHDSAGALDLARAARALMTLLSELPDVDRMLMEEVALGGRDGPMGDRERQRVHRLRQRLLESLRARLGHDPVEFLRRL